MKTNTIANVNATVNTENTQNNSQVLKEWNENTNRANGAILISLFKSSAKNAKCEIVNYYTHNDKTSDHVIYQIASVLERVVYHYQAWESERLLKSNSKPVQLNFRFSYSIDRLVHKKTVTNPEYYCVKRINTYTERRTRYSIEEFLNVFLDTILTVDPDVQLSAEDLFANPSIKYFIKKWYHHNAEAGVGGL